MTSFSPCPHSLLTRGSSGAAPLLTKLLYTHTFVHAITITTSLSPAGAQHCILQALFNKNILDNYKCLLVCMLSL